MAGIATRKKHFRQDLEALSGTVARLRIKFLLPFIGASAITFGIWTYALSVHEQDMIEEKVSQTSMLIGKMYDDDIEHEARMLEAAMVVIQRDGALQAALARRDRAVLLRLSVPLNDELRRRFGITHFYFSGPDRVNILRVHQPGRHGDVINRFTTLQAERTGATSYGVELGPLGTFTLRLVTPWYSNAASKRHLIGYVELGMEIDHTLLAVQTFSGVPVFVMIAKNYLRHEEWEAGMRMLGRIPDWDRFPDAVLSNQAADVVPPALAERLAVGLPKGVGIEGVKQTHVEYRAVFRPLIDAADREVGQMVALIDISPYHAAAHRVMYLGTLGGVFVVAFLTVFFSLLTGRIGRQIEHDAEELSQLATHDGLTGLYNHRMFYELLDDEFQRAQRFEHSVSLLMLDIDHFKRVNDTHGHQAGDAILRGLGELLGREARAIDRVCRYGGEEITVILPETGEEDAVLAAERLRAAVASHPFEVEGGEPIRITVSIGVASSPDHAESSALAAAADAALYVAKQAGRNRVVREQASPAA